MKKKYLLILILILTVGFASINTVLDLKGNVSIGFKEDDFSVEISKIVIDNGSIPITLSEDKQSFTFTGTGSNKIEYKITNKSYQYDANINIICEPSENIVINQVGEVVAQSKKSATIEANSTGVITCRMDIDKISKTEIAEDMCEYDVGQTWEFNYTGNEQTFEVPCDGEYKIELWGASGSPERLNGIVKTGGAYTSGEISLTETTLLYVYVGEQAFSYSKENTDYTNLTFAGTKNAFNGGGKGNRQCGDGSYYGGIDVAAGATDIRTIKGTWNDINSLRSRIMVAAASGGTTGNSDGTNSIGGPGGGLTGYSGTRNSYGTGATQVGAGSVNGSFGAGGNANWTAQACNLDSVGGGSGGWYGGGGATAKGTGTYSSGGSGSSYISGHAGCIAVTSSTDTTPKCSSNSSSIDCSISWTNYYFTNTVMIDGAGYKWTNVKGEYVGMPSHDGLSTMTGNTGHGYAKITYLG